MRGCVVETAERMWLTLDHRQRFFSAVWCVRTQVLREEVAMLRETVSAAGCARALRLGVWRLDFPRQRSVVASSGSICE